jgi:ATP-binding cassette, subfamily B, bacterial MsbA
MKSYFRLLSFAGNLQKIAIPFVFTSLIAAIFGVLNLVLLKPLLDILFGQVSQDALMKMAVKPKDIDLLAYFNYYFAQIFLEKGKLGGLQFVCVVIVLGILISNVFRYLSMRILESFKVNMVANLRQAVFDKAINLPLSFFSNERKGNLISRIITDVQEVENSIASSFSAATKEFLLLFGYLTALFLISVKLSLFALIVIPITGAFLGIILKRMRQDAGDSQVRLSNLISLMDEAFGGMRVVKGFVAEKFISNKFKNENQAYKKSVFAYGSKREMANPFSEFIGVTMVASLLLYGGTMILSGESDLTASMFIAFIVVFSQVVRPAKDISQAFGSSQRGIASGERILEILDTPNPIHESESAISHNKFEKAIRFDNVSFAYDEDNLVLKNINFELTKGKTLALVGSSGGGKSTIADLIPRFYDPKQGIISIDGIDVREISQSSLRSLMGIVTQEPILFNDTIYNNIAFGFDTDEQSVMEAAKIANAHEFILSQPEAYQTVIGDRGTKLSGGQRQRLSIARAILQNPPILILDEATSALDTESEKLVQDALLKLMQNRTTLVIAHRLSTIQKADEILVIVDGEIHERGSHAQLFDKEDGFYRKLVLMQEM